MLSNLSDRSLLVLGALLCGIAAWCTIGYHHPDEHFQIWEFANYKLGTLSASQLPWEFSEQMRPGLQPFLAYQTVLVTRALGLDNPFTQVFLTRLLSGIAALGVYWNWCNLLERDFQHPINSRWMRMGVLFFWLMPYLNVRFSSENTSAISFLGGLLLLLTALEHPPKKVDWKLMLGGFLLALSFFFRYQIAFAGLGLGAWLLWIKRPGIWSWVNIVLGAILALALGFATDYWLYGEWVCAPYNYFTSNITEGKAANFGVSPFWWYLTEMPVALLPPLSIGLIGLTALGIWKKPLHVLSWCIVPFILAHSMVAHKEVRFLFPMALPFFFFAAVGWEAFLQKWQVKPWMNGLFRFCLWVNVLVLLLRICIPAKELAAYAKFLWNWNREHPGASVFFVTGEPKKEFPLNMPFYKHPDQTQRFWYTSPSYQNDTTALRSGDLMFYTEDLSSPPSAPGSFQLKRVYAYYPEWLLQNNTNDWQGRSRVYSIYELSEK